MDWKSKRDGGTRALMLEQSVPLLSVVNLIENHNKVRFISSVYVYVREA